MIKLETIELVKQLITAIIAYVPVVTLSGFFTAALARLLGDDTPKENGFLTLNPGNHVEPFLFILTLIPPFFCFTRQCPLNPGNIRSPFKNLKISLLYFASAISFLLIAILFLFLFSLAKLKFYAYFVNFSLNKSVFHVFTDILRYVLLLSIFWFIFSFIQASVKLFIYFYVPELEEYVDTFVIGFMLPVLLIFLLGDYVEVFLRLFLIKLEYIFNYLLI